MSADPSAPMLTRVHTTLVRYPRFNELQEDIRLCQEASAGAGEAQCMSLEGLAGAGKSTLVRTYAEVWPRYETPSGTKIPVFYLETPSPVTVKGMAARMLEALGDPAAHKGALWSMNSRLIQYIRVCEVQLIILDDFHHLIDKETNRILGTVSDWLKVLIKETNVPFLVVGTEGKVEHILTANPQLSRLFAVRETLEPFGWSPSNEITIKVFAAFIKYVETGIGVSLSDELSRLEWLHRLHYATDGVVGNVMNLIRFATLLGHKQNASCLTCLILSQAFDKRLHKHLAEKVNPFTVDPQQHFTVPDVAGHDTPDSVSQRSKRQKRRGPRASDVLSTH